MFFRKGVVKWCSKGLSDLGLDCSFQDLELCDVGFLFRAF